MKGQAADTADDATATMHFMFLHRWFHRGQLGSFTYSERDLLCNQVLNARLGEMGQGLQPKLKYDADDIGARISYFPDDLANSPQAVFACQAKLMRVTERWKASHEILKAITEFDSTRALGPGEQPRSGYSAFVPSAYDHAFDLAINAAIEAGQAPDGTDVHRLALMSTFPPRTLPPTAGTVGGQTYEVSREALLAALTTGFQFSPRTQSFVSAVEAKEALAGKGCVLWLALLSVGAATATLAFS